MLFSRTRSLVTHISSLSKQNYIKNANFQLFPRFTIVRKVMSLSKPEVSRISSIYKNISKTPFVENGWVSPSMPSQLIVQYSQRDVRSNQKQRFLRYFNENLDGFTSSPFALNMSNVVGFEPSPSWRYLCVIRSVKKEGDKEDKYSIEIWDSGFIVASIPTEGVHAQVYADIWFGSIVWSKDENYIAYIAERNAPKTASFFEKEKDDVSIGNKYDYKEDWGETYKGSNPSIFIASIKDEKVKAVPNIPEHLSSGQVQWTVDQKSIVFTAWNTQPRRLGILHCYNRESAVYKMDVDLVNLFIEDNEKKEDTKALTKEDANALTLLSKSHKISRSPRFSSDGKVLVYLSSNHDKTHNSASKLIAMDCETGDEQVIIDIVDEYPEGDAFPGLFVGSLPTRAFISKRKVILSSIWKSSVATLLVDLESKEVQRILIPGHESLNVTVKDVREDAYIVLEGSEVNKIPSVFVGKWKDGNFTWSNTPDSPALVDHGKTLSNIEWKYATAELPKETGFPGVEYILTTPSFKPQEKKFPVILFPHGGPHSTSVSAFSVAQTFFTSLGYVVIQINYRGSLGFGQKYVDALPGQCGTMDVHDCFLVLKDALEKNKEILDPNNLFVMGGSHGGYLTGHLIGRDNYEWNASVLINPVTNMAHCVGISDIPDWCYVESGTEVLSAETLKTMYEKSPIAYVDRIKSPTMIVLGDSDKRVPISQSIEYYHKLKARGIITRMLKYPGEGHGIAEPEHEADYLINIALWFNQNLK